MPTPPAKAAKKQTTIKLKRTIFTVEESLDEWISAEIAGRILGLSRTSVLRLCEECDPITTQPYLKTWRPQIKSILINTQSVIDHMRATQSDPEFWSIRRARSASLRR